MKGKVDERNNLLISLSERSLPQSNKIRGGYEYTLKKPMFKILRTKNLLSCHFCRETLAVGDRVVSRARGGQNGHTRRYHKECWSLTFVA